MPKPRTIPQIDAMRITVLHTKVGELRAKKELKQLEIQQIDQRITQCRTEIQEVFDRNGFRGMPVGAVLAEEDGGYPAGTVMQLDQTPYMEPDEEPVPPTA